MDRGRDIECGAPDNCRRRSYSGEPLPNSTTAATTTSRRMMMTRSRSLSHSRLAASSCACFAPLPDYAKYQERKIQRALSRGSIFVEPASPRFETRQTRSITMDDLMSGGSGPSCNGSCTNCNNNNTGRQPVSPTRISERASPAVVEAPFVPFGPKGSQSAKSHCQTRDTSCSCLPQVPIAPPPYSSVVSSNTRAFASAPNTATWGGERHVEQQQTQPKEPARVEISPGVTVVLRCVDETMKAIRNDFFLPVSCLGCSLDLFCIADAQYVICPTCRVVSPLMEMGSFGRDDGEHKELEERWGLGLGVTYESLVTIQSEIVASGR